MKIFFHASASFLAICALALAIEHFSHEPQPDGTGNKVPGIDHVAGRTLAEIPDEEFEPSLTESSLDYVTRVTDLVHEATYHCRPTDNSLSLIEGQVTRVALSLGYNPEFELGLYGKRLKCGFCSERAAAVTRILKRNGFKAAVWGINGHVISRVTIDGVTYYADADYGVGAYRADLPSEELKKIYLKSRMPLAADMVAGMITDKTDDAAYYSGKYFKRLRTLRRALFTISDVIAYGLVIAVAAAAAFPIARARRVPDGNLANMNASII